MASFDEFRSGIGREGFQGALGSLQDLAILLEHEGFFGFVGVGELDCVFLSSKRGAGGMMSDDIRVFEREAEESFGDGAERRANIGDVFG